MKKLLILQLLSLAVLVAALLLEATIVNAQEPKAPAKGFPPSSDARSIEDDDQVSSSDLRPDSRPLTGVQETTLGAQEMRHSYWLPGFQYANLSRSGSANLPGVTNWNSTSYLTGNLSLLDAWSHSQLSMNYSGGGVLSTDRSLGSNYFHQFGLMQTIDWQRTKIQFFDEFSYLPDAQFGFGGMTNLSLPGVGGTIGAPVSGLQNNYIPNQSILFSAGPRYSNAFVIQTVYELSRNVSLTAAGSYGILRFVDPGNINSDDVIGGLGINYMVSRRDTLGILYRFTDYQFGGNPQRIGDHAINFAYGRKITGRLALQIFGGPDISVYRVPISQASSRISASGGATISYGTPRSGIYLTYNHGTSNGSGVLVGSTSDQISGTLNHRLGLAWRGNVNFGYARNRSVGQNQGSPSFDSYYGGGGIDRQLGRNATFSLGYTAYFQNSSVANCNQPGCVASPTVHQISLGITWHTRPYVIR